MMPQQPLFPDLNAGHHAARHGGNGRHFHEFGRPDLDLGIGRQRNRNRAVP
jgi:hypothetical protein